jgi:hypothetical protein
MIRTASAFPATLFARLRDTSWSTLLGYMYFLMIAGLLFKLALPASIRPYLRGPLLAAPLVLLVAKDLSHLPDLLLRVRAVSGAGWLATLRALLPPKLFAMFNLDREMRRGFIAWLRRIPAPAPPAGQSFGYLERGSYGTVVAIILVSIFSEAPFAGLISSIVVDDPAKRLWVHLILGALSAYSLVWVLADRWAVRASAHVLADACLLLQVGARTRCPVPLAAIESCQRIDEPPAKWCARHGGRVDRALLVTPFDRPNVVLTLADGADVSAWHLGERRGGLKHIFLYLDRPEALVAALPACRA